MSDIERKDVVAAFPGRRVTFRRVSFADLARGEAYRLTVEGVNDRGDVFSPEEAATLAPLVATLEGLAKGRTYKGGRLIF